MTARIKKHYLLHKLAKKVKHDKCGQSLILDAPLGQWGCKRLLKAMVVNHTVRLFCLERNHLRVHNCEQIRDMMASNATLTVLSLFECQIGPVGGRVFAPGIETAPLVALSLAMNNLGPVSGGQVIRAAAANTTLETLDLHANNLTPINGLDVGELMRRSSTVTTLFLAHNNFGIEGGRAIAEALPMTKALTTLFLSTSSLGTEGAVAIAEALKNNETLTILRLDDNNIGPAGGVAMAEALRHNDTLTALGYRKNHIGPEGGHAIMQSLRRSESSLRFLDLSKNNIGNDTGLADLLLCNHTLISLHLVDATIDREEYVSFIQCLVQNPSLVDIRLRIENPSREMLALLANSLERNQHNSLIRRRSLFHLSAIVSLRERLDLSCLPSFVLRRLSDHFSSRNLSAARTPFRFFHSQH